jgi:hypothetical protein
LIANIPELYEGAKGAGGEVEVSQGIRSRAIERAGCPKKLHEGIESNVVFLHLVGD